MLTYPLSQRTREGIGAAEVRFCASATSLSRPRIPSNSAPLFSASNNSSEPMDVNYIAPAFASAETFVEARSEVIWEVLTGIDRWPEWNSEVTRAELEGPLQAGIRFRWKAAGMPIVSTLQTVEPYRKIGWTGHPWVDDPGGSGRCAGSYGGIL